MSEMSRAPVGNLDPTQARELAVLVELEARWENLRKNQRRDAEGKLTLPNLVAIQKAYASFRVNLVAYNKRYKPAHVPELLLNTPARVGAWCRAMRDLYRQVENDAKGLCPTPLLEKAYRSADRVSVLMKKDPATRAAPTGSIRDAILEMDALVKWCDDLLGVTATIGGNPPGPVEQGIPSLLSPAAVETALGS